MPVDGNCNYEVNHLKNMTNNANIYGKKQTEVITMNNTRAVRQIIGRPENDIKTMLADSVERNTSLFHSQLDGNDARSLLRQRSIKSMIKINHERSLANKSRQDSSYKNQRPDMMLKSSSSVVCIDSPLTMSPANARAKASSVLENGDTIMQDSALTIKENVGVFSATAKPLKEPSSTNNQTTAHLPANMYQH